MTHIVIPNVIRRPVRQSWRDLLSVYYANTPIWRWLKSGALLFMGVGLWAGTAAVYSVTGWRPLLYVMAYGFLLIFWGPFTHMVVVPLTIRLRRSASSKPARLLSRNSGKINLSIFFACVIILATFVPGMMLLDFSPSTPSGGSDVRGDLVCSSDADTVTCEVVDPDGFDHVVVMSGDRTIRTLDEAPYEFTLQRDELDETRAGDRFAVEFRDEDGNTLQRLIERV